MKFFLCSSSLHEWKIRSCHTTWQSPHKEIVTIFFLSISLTRISRILTFSLMERTSRFLLGLEALPESLLLTFGAIVTLNKGFLNKITAVTRPLIRRARTLEAECWQVCGEAWVRGQRKMNQVLGALGLLDFTMLRSVLLGVYFETYETLISLIFQIFSGRVKPRITETANNVSADTGVRLYSVLFGRDT